MPCRPVVRRTYGKAKLAPSSSSSNIYLGSSDPVGPSSPPSSSFLATPPTSPGLDARDDASPPSSPSPKRRRLDEVEVLEPTTTTMKAASQSSLMSYFAAPRGKPLQTLNQIPSKPKPRPKAKLPDHSMTQMHLTHLPLLHTCQECLMSYMRGGSDESLHSKHHAKVVRGIAWDGLGKGKAKEGTGWRVLEEGLRFGDTGRGRVIVCDGSWGGLKVGRGLKTPLTSARRHSRHSGHGPVIPSPSHCHLGSVQNLPLPHIFSTAESQASTHTQQQIRRARRQRGRRSTHQ